MKLPYGYVLVNEEIIMHEEKADAVRSIFEYYLAGASLGKIVDVLHAKGIPSPSGNPKWGRAAVDKLLSNVYSHCWHDDIYGCPIRTGAPV